MNINIQLDAEFQTVEDIIARINVVQKIAKTILRVYILMGIIIPIGFFAFYFYDYDAMVLKILE